MSIQAYQRTAAQADTPRDLEYRAFGQVTASLVRCHESGETDPARLAAALESNRRLWNVLSSDCSMPENSLPMSLRASIISLAIWVAKYSSQVVREKADIGPLIEVNRSLMEGLAGR
jgi:flagellar protein FlaF